MSIKIKQIGYHRNGISGNGFYVVLFEDNKAQPDATFMGTLFDEDGSCAVVCLDMIPECGIEFAAGNSWRGDCFEASLRAACKHWTDNGGPLKPHPEIETYANA